MTDEQRAQAYQAGAKAYRTNRKCPYPILCTSKTQGLRQVWWEGYLDEKYTKYDHIPH